MVTSLCVTMSQQKLGVVSGKVAKKSYPKIRSITRKSDGFKLRVISASHDEKFRQNHQMVADAKQLSIQGDGEPIHGYAIVTWDAQGYRENAYGWKDGSVLAPASIPEIVKESLTNSFRHHGHINRF